MAESRNLSPTMSAREADGGGLSPRTVELVRKSWAAVLPISDAAASLFYERLFELDPSVKPLFKNDMREQKKKLMQTLSVAVDGLSNLEKLVPVLKALGVRHVGYMVQDHHYDTVGEALLWTLKEGLGDAFTAEVERAWKEIYGIIARVMKQAAAEHGAAKPELLARSAALAPKEPIAAQRAASRGGSVVVGVGRGIEPPPDSTHPAGRTLQGVAASFLPARPSAPARAPAPAAVPAGLSARTVDLVQDSWRKVLPISDAAASLFYERLFELDPSVKPLFKNDMREQKKKLMQTLTVAVDGLSNPQRLIPTLEALGVRHAGYMVQERHYDTVGQALLWTLKEGLGNAFTSEVEAAWTAVYGLVADVMKKAAAHQEPAVEQSLDEAPLTEDDETRVQQRSSAQRSSAPTPHAGIPAQVRSSSPALVAPEAPEAPEPPAAPAALPVMDNRPIVLHIDGQSLPPLSVRVTLEGTSPFLNKGQEGAGLAPPPRDGLVGGLLLGTLCLIFSMISAGLVALATQKALSPSVFLGMPLSALALAITAFALGYLWGKPRSAAGRGKS